MKLWQPAGQREAALQSTPAAGNCTESPVTAVTAERPARRYSNVQFLSSYHMFAGRLTQTTLRALDWLASHTLPPEDIPAHQRTGRRGEEDAYFYLRRRGFVIISRNYRSPHHRGELDLIGWDKDVLCFIEVKTRTTHAVKPAEVAVDRDKQRDLWLVARDFLRLMPPSCQWRFDVLAVYYEPPGNHPSFELFQNAFSVSYNQ
jgi:putative endonuclease